MLSTVPTPTKIDAAVFDNIKSFQSFDWESMQVVVVEPDEIATAPPEPPLKTKKAKKNHRAANANSTAEKSKKKRKVGISVQVLPEYCVCTSTMHEYISNVVFTPHVSRRKTPMWLSTTRKILFKAFAAKFSNLFVAQVRKVTGSRYGVNKYLRHGHIILRKIDEETGDNEAATVDQIVTAARRAILKAPIKDIAAMAVHLEFYGIFLVIVDTARLFVCEGAIVICDKSTSIVMYHRLPQCDTVLQVPAEHVELNIQEKYLQSEEKRDNKAEEAVIMV